MRAAKTRYHAGVPELVRKHARFFLVAGLAGVALRLFFLFRFPGVVDDSRLYANIADNWLQHGVYAITDSGKMMLTLSRLPGYPAFLAAVFAIFGHDNFRAVLLVQLLFDVGTCFLVADFARRLLSDRAAKAAFLLAAVCPFLANYAAAVLTETLEIFFTALALDLAIVGLSSFKKPDAAAARLFPQRTWLMCGFSIAAAILLRPDGGLLLTAIAAYLVLLVLRTTHSAGFRTALPFGKAILLLILGAIAPLVPWTVRNLYSLHRFEPLAPRYANDSDEMVMAGFNRWTKTWMADYVSVEEIYWNVPGDTIDVKRLPARAFDLPQQRQETVALFADYNRDRDMSPELDGRFAALAAERIHAAPLRYYAWLPILRIADMWMRPRTELLPPDPRWWEFNDDRRPLAVSLGFGLLNLLYLGMAAAGLLRRRVFVTVSVFLGFVLLRSAFLGTLENPEPRYTLECYPVVILLAAALFGSSETA